MKGTFSIEYDVDEDSETVKIYILAKELHCAMWEFSQWLRGVWKHEEHSEEVQECVEKIRSKFYECIREYDAYFE